MGLPNVTTVYALINSASAYPALPLAFFSLPIRLAIRPRLLLLKARTFATTSTVPLTTPQLTFLLRRVSAEALAPTDSTLTRLRYRGVLQATRWCPSCSMGRRGRTFLGRPNSRNTGNICGASARGTAAVRLRPRRTRSARLAQEEDCRIVDQRLV